MKLNSENKNLIIFEALPSTNDNIRYLVSKGRNKFLNKIQDNIIIFKQFIINRELKSIVKIIEFNFIPQIEYFYGNKLDFFDSFENHLILTQNKAKKGLKIVVYNDCFQQFPLIWKKEFQENQVFKMEKNKKENSIEFSFMPEKIFEGNIFKFEIYLDNEMERYLKI